MKKDKCNEQLHNSRKELIEILKAHIHEVLIIILIFFCSLFSSHFFEVTNISNYLFQLTPILLLAVGQTFALLLGGIDLTQGAVVGITSYLFVLLASKIGTFYSLVIVLVIVLLQGFIIGYSIGRFKINPFVITLSFMYILSGFTLFISRGTPITDYPESARKFLELLGNCEVSIFPLGFLISIALLSLAWFVLKGTMLGLQIYAVGESQKAADALGLKISLAHGICYALSALFAGFSSLFLTSRIMQGNPQLGDGVLFDSIGSAVLGGVALSGGVGGVWAATRGAIIVILIRNGLGLTDLDAQLREIAIGLLILVGGIIAIMRKRGKEYEKC